MAYTDIDKPSDYFNTKLYTGNGASSHAISGVGFQSDWTWIKNRSSAVNHALTDSVRTAPLRLMSQSTEAEINQTTGLLSFNSDGFTVGSDSGYNGNGNSMVSWNWKAGGSASSNSNGSITSSVSASTDAGFSIVSYTGNGSAGATVGHGLGSVPQMLILKGRDQVENWTVYHEGLTSNNYALRLNGTAAQFSQTLSWNNTTPTSSVFTLGGGAGTSDYTNRSGTSMIAYCFAEKQGYSKFGSYVGNGNADGTFVYTGFKPAFFLFKNSSSAGSWVLVDAKRPGFNVINDSLNTNNSNAENTATVCDFTSNGVKFRTNADHMNGSYTFIYMAFAENPFVTSTGVPATAR